MKTSCSDYGYFTVTQEENLIYADKHDDSKITEFIKIGDWQPLQSVYSSHINGDTLVGMMKDKEAISNVTRYSKTGNEVQNMQKDNDGELLIKYPQYITENINGDICTSDYIKQAMVVMNKPGKHRFSSRGQGVDFRPRGICTDVLGHILVYDFKISIFNLVLLEIRQYNIDFYICVLLVVAYP